MNKRKAKAFILPCDKNVKTLSVSFSHKVTMPWLFKANVMFNILNTKISGKFSSFSHLGPCLVFKQLLMKRTYQFKLILLFIDQLQGMLFCMVRIRFL